MTINEIFQLIHKGEGFHLEFKLEDESNEDFAKTIVSFANTDGGKILVGIDDSGAIIGVSDIDKVMLKLDDIALNRCEPPVSLFQESATIEEKKIIIVHVHKGDQRPYKTKSGQYYVRASNRCRQATREELLRIFQSVESLYYDELPVNRASASDLDVSSFKKFFKTYLELTVEDNDEAMHYMKNFHLMTKDTIPTVTGMLFFGYEPQTFFPHARIVCSVIEGTDIGETILETKNIDGAVPSMLSNAESFFKISLKRKHTIQDFEPEFEYEIPLTALRESVVNAIAHRDYTISAPVRIIIFTDRIEIHSPGRLPNTVTVEDIKVGGAHVLRNPTVYNMLLKMKMVTDLGSGVRRIIKLIHERLQSEVGLINTDNEFVVIIPRKVI